MPQRPTRTPAPFGGAHACPALRARRRGLRARHVGIRPRRARARHLHRPRRLYRPGRLPDLRLRGRDGRRRTTDRRPRTASAAAPDPVRLPADLRRRARGRCAHRPVRRPARHPVRRRHGERGVPRGRAVDRHDDRPGGPAGPGARRASRRHDARPHRRSARRGSPRRVLGLALGALGHRGRVGARPGRRPDPDAGARRMPGPGVAGASAARPRAAHPGGPPCRARHAPVAGPPTPSRARGAGERRDVLRVHLPGAPRHGLRGARPCAGPGRPCAVRAGRVRGRLNGRSPRRHPRAPGARRGDAGSPGRLGAVGHARGERAGRVGGGQTDRLAHFFDQVSAVRTSRILAADTWSFLRFLRPSRDRLAARPAPPRATVAPDGGGRLLPLVPRRGRFFDHIAGMPTIQAHHPERSRVLARRHRSNLPPNRHTRARC